MYLVGSKEAQKVTNHPVHVQDQFGNFSPTAFIPFCVFGGNMSAMGVKIDQFDVPVCNIFKAKLHKDQLCYEADIDNFKQESQNTELSVSFFIHYNEDRMLSIANQKSHEEATNVIVVDTIGIEI